MEALMLVARGGPTILARIGVMRALHAARGRERSACSTRLCDQIPTPAENQLDPYSEHSCAHRHSRDFGKLFGN